jgi:hypothetical protein
VQLHGHVRITGHINLTIIEPDGTTRPRQKMFGEKAIIAASTNEALREALRTYASAEHDWPALYIVFETIEKANNGKIPRSWATKDKVTDFTRTASRQRHGFGAFPQEKPRITVAQARSLVQKIFRAWIDHLIASG